MRLNTDNQAIELLLADEEESHSTYTLTQKNTTTLFVDWCRIQWETTKLPSFLYRWASPRVDHRGGSCQAQGWLWWFNIGIVVGSLLMPAAVIVCFITATRLIQQLEHKVTNSNNTGQHPALLVATIPGVNLPWTHLPLQFMAIGVASLWHEMGHALAAINARIPLHQIGAFFWFIYPGAFVRVDSHALNRASTLTQLRIMLGGVWHNMILVAIAIILLYTGLLDLPWPWLGWERITSGVVVTSISTTSPLYSVLPIGSRITQIGQTALEHGIDGWSQHLSYLESTSLTTGYCWNKEKWYKEPNDCCLPKSSNQPTKDDQIHWCFSGATNNTEICVPIIKALPKTTLCNKKKPCPQSDQICYFPRVETAKEQLLQLYYEPPLWFEHSNTNNNSKIDNPWVVWIGRPIQLYHQLRVGRWRSWFYSWPTTLPELPELFIRYLIAFSAAIGLLNAAPVYGLDGQHVLQLVMPIVTTRPSIWTRLILVGCSGLMLFVLVGILFLR
ncbi:peptidase family M50-domain-containing protein [Syncephalis fuscata]|nr:peptidase family M50-domain-containing protein [Syncephalis fuscata]